MTSSLCRAVICQIPLGFVASSAECKRLWNALDAGDRLAPYRNVCMVDRGSGPTSLPSLYNSESTLNFNASGKLFLCYRRTQAIKCLTYFANMNKTRSHTHTHTEYARRRLNELFHVDSLDSTWICTFRLYLHSKIIKTKILCILSIVFLSIQFSLIFIK